MGLFFVYAMFLAVSISVFYGYECCLGSEIFSSWKSLPFMFNIFFYMLPYHELTYYCDAKHGAGLAKF